MAAALPPRDRIPPEEKARLAEKNRQLAMLIHALKELPKDSVQAVAIIQATGKLQPPSNI